MDYSTFELDCIRKAAGQPGAKVQPFERSSGLRSRTYLLDDSRGGSFVKCLDAGYLNPSSFFLSLEHEAEGYRLFAPLDDGFCALPELRFFETFPGPDGKTLQVLGLTDLRSLGGVVSPREIYLDPGRSAAFKEHVASLCGRTMARIVSADFQACLDRDAALSAVRGQMDLLLNHPQREDVLALLENHEALPWAYQNSIMGEMNVFLPRWLAAALRETAPEYGPKLELLGRVVTDRRVTDLLAPGPSADRIVLSPHDRHDGNTLLLCAGEQITRSFEIDLEFWGLETIGRMIGRYLAVQSAGLQFHPGEKTRGGAQNRNSQFMGSFLYHFIRGDGQDSPEVALRAVSVGLASFHAAIFGVYVAALFPPAAATFVDGALHCVERPGCFLTLAADYAERQPSTEAEIVLETVGQVWIALQPLKELAAELLA